MRDHLNDALTDVTSQPGVYLMKDDTGKIIYVGKARNLKKRLSAYFKKNPVPASQFDMKTAVLVKKIASFDTIITGSEKEALILESTLIKRYRPRYNVILKDGKRYPSLRLDIHSPFPNLTIVRKTDQKDVRYFGPYASAGAVHETLRLIHRTFKLRKCKTKDLKDRPRPCLNYQMGICLAPCSLDVDPAQYRDIVKEVTLFLKGRTPNLISKIRKEMAQASEARDYERAVVLRDKLFALEKTLEKQVAVTTDFQDRDVIGLARLPEASLIALLTIRGGYLMGTSDFSFSESLATDGEMISVFLRQYYDTEAFIPGEILTPIMLDDVMLLEEAFADVKGRRVRIRTPQRGEKHRLIAMAKENADKHLQDRIASIAAREETLLRLGKALKIEKTPWRIECFDNSTLAGAEPVSGMVVFEKGNPLKADYRKYKLKPLPEPDDYAYMAEVLKRRYRPGDDTMAQPDLLVVDGGKGQLNIALSVLRELGLEEGFAIIGIAKKDESRGETEDKIYIPGRSNPISFGRAGDLLLFLQRIRDEAHRFAVSFHRKRRSKTSLQSALDSIPGIGKKRKTALLTHFRGVKNIRAATIDDLTAVPGINRKVAEVLKRHLIEKTGE